jgi:hypothetical protein
MAGAGLAQYLSMIRRLALLVALLLPSAGLAQAGSLAVVPTAFGASDCTASPRAVTITWTSSSTVAVVTDDVYRIFLSTGSIACSAATTGVTQFRQDIQASTLTQTYPAAGDLALTTSNVIVGASTTCGTTATINVCVQHVGTASTTPKGYALGTVTYEAVAPPVPVSVSVQPGDSSLFVTWAAGTSTGVAAASYNVTATPASGAPTVQGYTGRSNNRISGLINGVTYAVTVTAVSAGGNESVASSPAVSGTPEPVSGFWEQYKNAGGVEQGGCSGGPAGVLALLGVALALAMRGLRRRS